MWALQPVSLRVQNVIFQSRIPPLFFIPSRHPAVAISETQKLHLWRTYRKAILIHRLNSSVDHTTTEVISQSYNRPHQLRPKETNKQTNKDSERTDTRFNGCYELIQKYTPFPQPHSKVLTGDSYRHQMALAFANILMANLKCKF